MFSSDIKRMLAEHEEETHPYRERILELERQNTDLRARNTILESMESDLELKEIILQRDARISELQARNTELVEKNRVQGKALKNSCCPSCGYRYEVKIWIKGLDGELDACARISDLQARNTELVERVRDLEADLHSAEASLDNAMG